LTSLHTAFYTHQLKIRELLSRSTNRKQLVADQRQLLGDHYAYVEHFILQIRNNPEVFQLIARYCDPNLHALELLMESFAYSFFCNLMNSESSSGELLQVISTLLKREFDPTGTLNENISGLVGNILEMYTKHRSQRKYLKLILKRPVMKFIHVEGKDLKLDPVMIYQGVMIKRDACVKFEAVATAHRESFFSSWFTGAPIPKPVSLQNLADVDKYDVEFYLNDPEVQLQISCLSDRIIAHVTTLLHSIYSNIPTMPYGVRWISKCISDLALKRGALVHDRNNLLATFLFIKWWLPSITSADLNGLITDTVISTTVRSNLTLISNVRGMQVIKHICRGTAFTGQQYDRLNNFIRDQVPKMQSYFEAVIKVEDLIVGGETKVRRQQTQRPAEPATYLADKDTMRYYYTSVLSRLRQPKLHKSMQLGTLHDFKFQGVVLSIEEVKLLVAIVIRQEAAFREKGFGSLVNDAIRIKKAQNQDRLFAGTTGEATLYLMFVELSMPKEMERPYDKATHNALIVKATDDYQSRRILSKVKEATRELLFTLDSLAIFFEMSTNCSLTQIVDFVVNFAYLFESKSRGAKFPVKLLAHFLASHLQKLPEDYRENNYAKLYTSIVADYEAEVSHKRKIVNENKQILLVAINSLEKHITDVMHEKRIQLVAKNTRDFISFIKSASIPVCVSVRTRHSTDVAVVRLKECKHNTTDFIGRRTFTGLSTLHQRPFSFEEKPTGHIKLIDEFADVFSNLEPVLRCTERSSDEFNIGLAFSTYIQILKAEVSQHLRYVSKPFEEIEAIVEEIERYLTRRMFRNIFPETQSAADYRLYRRTLELDWVQPEHLDISENSKQEDMWKYAISQLGQIDDHFSTAEKLMCLVDFVTTVVNILSLCASSESVGADECLPIVIYLIVKAQPRRMYSNLNYLAIFRNQQQMKGDAGFCCLQVKSAVEFIESLDSSSLSISSEEFTRAIEEARLRHKD
jgi:hypothetical protein